MPESVVIERLREELARLHWTGLIDADCGRFRDRQLADALRLWRDQRGPEGMPRRSAFTPQNLQPFLKKVALFERIDGPDGRHRYRARLTGQMFGRIWTEMSGHIFDDKVPFAYLPRWYTIGDGLLAHGHPIRLIGLPEAFGRDYLVAEILLAPMLDDDGLATQILAVVNAESDRSWSEIEAEEKSVIGQSGTARQ
jgi:hypothetical protein